MQLLKTLAKEGNAYVSGSYLARSGADVFNTFVLASPNGQVYTHDKDFPTTNIETSVYAGGEDEEFVNELTRRGVTPDPPTPIASRPGNIKSAVFALPDGISAGAALCWEQCRYRTARRLAGNVESHPGRFRLAVRRAGWRHLAREPCPGPRRARRGLRHQGGATAARAARGRSGRARQPRRRRLELAGQRAVDGAEVFGREPNR